MSIPVQLRKVAAEIVQTLKEEGDKARKRKATPAEESEWKIGKESQAAMDHYLDSIIKKAKAGALRYQTYTSERGDHPDCPWCWIAEGRQSALVGAEGLRRTLMCELCGSRFPVGGQAND